MKWGSPKRSKLKAREMNARANFVNPALSLSVRRQCELLTVTRGQLCYAPKEERPENLEMMKMDQRIFLRSGGFKRRFSQA